MGNTTHLHYEAIHDIETELCSAVGIPINRERSGTAMAGFRLTLLNQVLDKLTDAEYDALSIDAQLWVAKAADLLEAGRMLPRFDEAKALTQSSQTPEFNNVVELKVDHTDPPIKSSPLIEEKDDGYVYMGDGRKRRRKTPKKKIISNHIDARKQHSDVDRKKAAGYRLKELLLKHGFSCHHDFLKKCLESEGYKISVQTIACTITEFRQTLRLLEKLGLLQKSGKPEENKE